MWKMPASGGATVPNPGTNFASTSDRAPCLANTPSVRRTQESGSSEILQSSCRILMPRTRPSVYHTESATKQAATLRKIEPVRLNLPEPASAPAANRIGSDGRGSPICSMNTHASRTVCPWCRRNSNVLCMVDRVPATCLRRYEGSSMPPTAAHHKFGQWLACPRGQLAFAQLLRKRIRIAWIPDRHCSYRFPIGRNCERLSRFIRVEASHLVHSQIARHGLNRKLRGGAANIMQSHSVRSALTLRLQMSHRQGQHRSTLCPTGVELYEHAQHLRITLGIILDGHEVSP